MPFAIDKYHSIGPASEGPAQAGLDPRRQISRSGPASALRWIARPLPSH